jgi:SAM-dependent methyltransferase
VLRAPAEDLPFDDAQFDVAVSALVLCTVADQPRALRELHRVLRPGGRLLFIEHVRSDEPGLRQWQDRLNWLNRIMAHGCNCNRPTLDTIRAAGFTITGLERSELRDAPPFVRPLVIGTATATGPGRPGAAAAATRSA